MNKRERKKYKKKHKTYVPPQDIWNLDYTISEFISPRLRELAKHTHSYPGRDEMDTPEKWISALNYMAETFELIMNDDVWDVSNPNWKENLQKKNERIEDGLQLFAKWFRDLWD